MRFADTRMRGYLTDAARAFDRAPVEVALALLTAFFFSYSIEKTDAPATAVMVLVAAVIAGAAAWSATLLRALGTISTAQRWIITGVGGLLGAFYLLASPDLQHEADAWRALLLVASAVLLVCAVPAFVKHPADPNLRLRRINARMAVRIIGIAIYGLALFAGLALALLAIDKLFELKLEDQIYAHVFFWIMLGLVPWVVAGGLDSYVAPFEEQNDVARVVHRLISFLVPPLVALYYLILCIYALRIAITGELPKNLVSPMVIAAGLLSALALVLFDPDAEGNARMRWLRVTPAVFLPLAALGLWALLMRIGDYGWTEFRLLRTLLLLTLLVLALLATLQLVRRRTFAMRIVPLVLGLLFAAAAVGPWNVMAVSRRDQQQRLADALRTARVDVNAAPAPTDTSRRVISGELYRRINSASTYLVTHFGDDALTAVVPERAPHPDVRRGLGLADFFHLRPATNDTLPHFYGARLESGKTVTMPNGDVIVRVEARERNGTASVLLRADTLRIPFGGDTLFADLRALLGSTMGLDGRGNNLTPAQALLPIVDRSGATRGTILLLDFNVTEEKGKRSLQYLNALLTVHGAEVRER